MPACRDCPFFDSEKSRCTMRDKPGCATRACVHGFQRLRLSHVYGDVLEIGAGVWKGPRQTMAAAGATVYSADPKWGKTAHPRAFCCYADGMPFPDDNFDFVVAVETIEHWAEGRHDTAKGLAECNRVLRPGAWLLATVPIHLHGSDPFILGDLPAIRALLGDGWRRIEFEAWRKDCEPLPPCYNWKTERPFVQRVLRRKFPADQMPANWLLEIRAQKKYAADDSVVFTGVG